MQFVRRTRSRRGPGLTPLIDVVFLLLVFFMLASRFETESLLPLGVQVLSDDESEARSADAPEELRLELDPTGAALVDGRSVAGGELDALLSSARRAEQPVRVRPAAETPLQPIVDLLARARAAGARDVALEGDPAWGEDGAADAAAASQEAEG